MIVCSCFVLFGLYLSFSKKQSVFAAQMDQFEVITDNVNVDEDASEELLESFLVEGDHLLLGSEEKMSEIAPYSMRMNNVTVQAKYRVSEFDSNDSGEGHKPQISAAIKYIEEDGSNGDGRGANGKYRRRNVYCLSHDKTAPIGQVLTRKSWKSAAVYHVIYYGAMNYGETCRYAYHSTGNWKWDYLATHFAIVVVTEQYTLDDVIVSIRRGNAPKEDQDILIRSITRMVNNALSSQVHKSFDEDGWFRMDDTTYSSFSLDSSDLTFTLKNGAYYTDWITPLFTTKNGYYANESITSLKNTTTKGTTVELKYSDSIHSPYRLVVEKATYEQWQKTGKTVTSKVTIKVPKCWKIASFEPSGDNTLYQDIGFPVYSPSKGYAEYTDSISITVPRKYIDLTVTKVSVKDDKDAGSQTLPEAEFTLYEDAACKKTVGSQVTDKNGQCTFQNLTYGHTYYLKETRAPEGYKLPDPVPVYLIDTNTKEQSIQYTVSNKIGMLLPETGSAKQIYLLVIGIGMMIYGIKRKEYKVKIYE